MSAVVISKSKAVFVGPSEPVTAAGDINLSSYDKVFAGSAVTTFFVFENPIEEPVETIKRGLAQALVHYYPVAGRLAAGAAAGDVVIRCTGEGVLFVAASTDCAMKDAQLSDASLKEELAVFYPAPHGFRYSDPLMLMQVTIFSCGGFVIGVTWNHVVGDGIGYGQFIQAVGELARGLPLPSVVPVRSEDSLTLGLPPFCASYTAIKRGLQPCPMALLEITIPSSLITRIKGNYSSMNHGQPCSVFDAVAAVLWRCRTRAIMSDREALAVLSFVSDEREYAGAKEGYYGNCVVPHLAAATCGAVASGHVVDLVKIIRRAKDRVPDVSAMEELRRLDGYDFLGVTCWRNIGLEAPDFGSGRPARVMGHWPQTTSLPLCMACIPCKDVDEYSCSSLCVREEHAGAFLQELAKMDLVNPLSASSKL